MKLRMAACAASVSFLSFIVLQLLNLFNFIESEHALMTQLVSIISLLLTGILVGILISDKKIPVKTALINMLFVIIGLALIPILTGITATIVNPFDLTIETKLAVTFILPTSIGVLYMWLFIRYRKKKDSTLW